VGESFTSIEVDITDPASPHYVLINGSLRILWDVDLVGQMEAKNGYQFNYSGTTLDTIDIVSQFIMIGSDEPIGGHASYMVIKERS
ncbi:uncharacterized protein METZ01_LOCUS202366, partial [marine metagenome]